MTALRNPLHLVTAEPAEARLRRLFATEDALLAELAEVRSEQRQARNLYAEERCLLIRPGLRVLREVMR